MSSSVLQTYLIRRNWMPILLQYLGADITKSSVDDLSNLTVGVTYTVTCKACNYVNNSTLIATSDPIVASTFANPPYITKVVVTRDMELMVFSARLGTEGQLQEAT